ncbi:MAG TPA: transcription antitermination factor NusB [Chthonomonadaceae bacterium]|nr:transcription antitermination factor NusB [Chthonomonadaceae bacterium]
MLSARRVAREWTLKILYQVDVGKVPLADALEGALDRLRLEFVHRGSRTASGSRAEEICLDAITRHLQDVLPMLRQPLQRALTAITGSLFEEAPYWQEVRLERAFRTHAPGLPLVPPRLLAPLPDTAFLPAQGPASNGAAGLTPEERATCTRFMAWARDELPRLLDPEMRATARAFAKELAADRPLGASPAELQAYLLRRRQEFVRAAEERWRKVGAMVQKQIHDWMRTAAFTIALVTGIAEHREALDRTLEGLSSGWRLDRQVSVDRNILRMAAFEMLYLPGIPTSASINEAIELAKKYSTAESGRFVNGVLGALAARVGDKLAPAGADTEREEADELVDISV